eukprot:1982743-Pleurochrysis_carterae.AAC.2
MCIDASHYCKMRLAPERVLDVDTDISGDAQICMWYLEAFKRLIAARAGTVSGNLKSGWPALRAADHHTFGCIWICVTFVWSLVGVYAGAGCCAAAGSSYSSTHLGLLWLYFIVYRALVCNVARQTSIEIQAYPVNISLSAG